MSYIKGIQTDLTESTSTGTRAYDLMATSTNSAPVITISNIRKSDIGTIEADITIDDTGGYVYFNFSLYDSSGELLPDSESGYFPASNGDVLGIGNLSPNTTYTARFDYSNDGVTSEGFVECTITTKVGSVDLWDWSLSNSPDHNATADQTLAAYFAATNKGAIGNFSYLVWNDLCAKVRELNLADQENSFWESDGWDPSFLTYEETKMTQTDKTLTADRFNSIRLNSRRKNDGITLVYRGDVVYGEYFVALTDSINERISAL